MDSFLDHLHYEPNLKTTKGHTMASLFLSVLFIPGVSISEKGSSPTTIFIFFVP